MEEDAEFIAEIVSNPADITARLVYADWLEEQGDPRGEFIRLQCKWDPSAPASPDQMEERAREHELLSKHGRAWSAEIEPLVISSHYLRGFIEYVEVEATQLIEHADVLLGRAPIRILNLRMSSYGTLRQHSLREVAETGVFRHLTGLSLEDIPLRIGDFEALAERPDELQQLERLCLVNCHIDDAMMKLLCARHMPDLYFLDLGNNKIRNAGVDALCRSTFAPNLRSLTLTQNQIRKKGGKQLAEAPWLNNLQELDIRRNHFQPADVEEIFQRVPEVVW